MPVLDSDGNQSLEDPYYLPQFVVDSYEGTNWQDHGDGTWTDLDTGYVYDDLYTLIGFEYEDGTWIDNQGNFYDVYGNYVYNIYSPDAWNWGTQGQTPIDPNIEVPAVEVPGETPAEEPGFFSKLFSGIGKVLGGVLGSVKADPEGAARAAQRAAQALSSAQQSGGSSPQQMQALQQAAARTAQQAQLAQMAAGRPGQGFQIDGKTILFAAGAGLVVYAAASRRRAAPPSTRE